MTCTLSLSDPLPLHYDIRCIGDPFPSVLYTELVFQPSLSTSFAGGVVTQDTLNSLVRGREAQKSARRLVGKRRLDSTEMVSTCISRDIYL